MKILKKLKNMLIDKPLHTISSTVLCWRYPFLTLYSAFSGLRHNWRFAARYHKKHYNECCKTVYFELVEDDKLLDNKFDYNIELQNGKKIWGNLFYNSFPEPNDLYVCYDNMIMHVYEFSRYFEEFPKYIWIEDCEEENKTICLTIRYNKGKALSYTDYPSNLSRFCNVVIDRWLYAKVKILDWIEKYPYQWIHFLDTYSWFDAIPYGWRKAFGKQMIKEIADALKAEGGRKALKEFRITDIKEKWGSLSLYASGYNDEVMKIIEKYEYISLRTCIKCGKTAYGITEGWITPLCKECFDKSTFSIIRPYYNEDNSWYGYTSSRVKEREYHPDFNNNSN